MILIKFRGNYLLVCKSTCIGGGTFPPLKPFICKHYPFLIVCLSLHPHFFYKIKLNNHPLTMMKKAVTPKKMAMNFHVITFFRSMASGNERPMTAIMKAMAASMATPFCTKISTIGTMPAALAYTGTATNTASGTLYHLSDESRLSKKPSGT